MSEITRYLMLVLVIYLVMYAVFRHKYTGNRGTGARAPKFLPLADGNVMLILSVIGVILIHWLPIAYFIFTGTLLVILVIYILDANMTKFFGYELTIWSIYYYLTHKEMAEQKESLDRQFLMELIYLLTLAALFALLLISLSFANKELRLLLTFFILTISILSICKPKINLTFYASLIISLSVFTALVLHYSLGPYLVLLYQSLSLLVIAAIILSNIMKPWSKTPSLNSSAYFLSFFQTKLVKHNSSITLHKTGMKSPQPNSETLNLNYQIPKPSKAHGLLEGKNVILLMHESVSDIYFRGPKAKASLPYYQELSSKLSVNYHIAISPNTSNSLFHLFSGSYADRIQYPYLAELAKQGYKNVMLGNSDIDSQPIYSKMLRDLGFNQIISATDSTPPLDKDYFLYQLGHLKKAIKGQKFFLMAKPGQTHIPYITSGKQLPKSFDRYIKACQESDAAFAELMNALSNTIDIDDTLIISTSDHGQSFGEFGYNAHSNAIIKEQLNVPCAFHHTKLQEQTIEHASHFDLMPTILDLLGVETPTKVLGRSILAPDHYFQHLIYSATRKSNAPSCFGMITKEGKYYRDLVYNSSYLLSLDDEIKHEYQGKDAKYMNEFYYQALNNAGLLGLLFKEYGEE